MGKFPIKSVFEQISHQIFQMKDVNEAKTFIWNFINEKDINEADKKTILRNVSECRTILKIQTYVCNSLLKYEGMSLTKPGKTPTPVSESIVNNIVMGNG